MKMSKENLLNKEYLPAAWAKRFKIADACIANNIKLGSEAAEECRQKYTTWLNVSYGEKEREKLDIYFKNKEEGKNISDKRILFKNTTNWQKRGTLKMIYTGIYWGILCVVLMEAVAAEAISPSPVDLLNKQYIPAEWTKRFKTAKECIANNIKLGTEEAEKCRQKYTTRLNVSYGEKEREKLDIYFKDKEEGSSIFVFIHGGNWQFISKDQSGFCIAPLVEAGHRVIILDYELCPNVSLQELTEEIKQATKFIIDYAKKTSAKAISFSGHSAGAHLFAYLLKEMNTITGSDLIKSVFLIGGIYDLTELWKLSGPNPNNALQLNAETAKQLSPLYTSYEQISGSNIKFYIYDGEYDTPTLVKHSKELAKHLKKFNLYVDFVLLDEIDHFDIIENLADDKFTLTQVILSELNKYK